jgi:hypothetical protein
MIEKAPDVSLRKRRGILNRELRDLAGSVETVHDELDRAKRSQEVFYLFLL